MYIAKNLLTAIPKHPITILTFDYYFLVAKHFAS